LPVVAFVAIPISAGWYVMVWSQTFVVIWHAPAVRVKFAGMRYGINHAGQYSKGLKGRVNRLLSKMGVSPGSAGPHRFPSSGSVSASYDTIWFALIPTGGTLVPDRDAAIFTSADGRKVSFGQNQNRIVNKGETYFMMAQIDQGVEAAKGGTLELIVAGRRQALIRIQ
jgi:hypothetical protein